MQESSVVKGLAVTKIIVTAEMILVTKRLMTNYSLPLSSAAAIVGNGCGESGPHLDPTLNRVHADHGSGGIMEWRDSVGSPRKTTLETYPGCGTREVQTDYIIVELRAFWPALYHQLLSPGERTVANLTANFCWTFENPNRALAELSNRIDHAQAVVDYFAKPNIAGAAAAIGGAAATTGAVIAASQQGGSGMAGLALVGAVGLFIAALASFAHRKAQTPPAAPAGPADKALTALNELRDALTNQELAKVRVAKAKAAVQAQVTEAQTLLTQG